MVEIIRKITTNVLTALYQNFWFSVLAAILAMFLYLFAQEHGWKSAIKIWIDRFKKSGTFRRIFVLTVCIFMILMRTLLNRSMWKSTLGNIMGGWTLTDANGNLTTEPIENIILMIPFTSLLLWALKDKIDTNNCVRCYQCLKVCSFKRDQH